VDGRADQFSLAVIAYELLTGERPFSGEAMPTLLFKIVREEPVAPQRLNPSLGWTVETVLKRALAKDPTERYQTCSDFIKALENACAASKGWKPLPPGSVQSLPTVQAPPEAQSKTRPRSEKLPPPSAGGEPERPSKLLRVARALALIIVAGGVLSALMVGGLKYFTERNQPPLQAENSAPEPAGSTAKPSPTPVGEVMPPKPAEPPPPQPAPNTKPEETKTAEPAKVPVEKPAPPGEISVRLVTSPPGATLVIDSNADVTCKTPCELKLASGRHTLSASINGYRRSLKIFELPHDSDVFINMERTTGTLMIKSEPPGAVISVDGQQRSEKTPAMLTLPTGSHRIEVIREGSRNYVEEVEVKDSVITNIDVNWAGRASNP
jgi:hypothetical protein